MEQTAKIVIVDDNHDLLFTMETFLKRNGFEVLTADDGRKGLDLIKVDPSQPRSLRHYDGDHLFRA